MQREPSESSEQLHRSNNILNSSSSSQHGFPLQEPGDFGQVRYTGPSGGSHDDSPNSASGLGRESRDAVDADRLDERLRGLILCGKPSTTRHRPITAGQRVSDHENAFTPSTPRQALGFKVIRRSDSSGGPQITDFPNEILTHILSHLHPDSHAAVALVSKRFYALVTTPHAWRMAFMRYFPGHTCLDATFGRTIVNPRDGPTSDVVRSDIRYFGRLTPLTTWRSEYLFRTRLMRSLVRGKPGNSAGGIGASGGAGKSSKRRSAVLTYNSKLPWLVTNIHAVFSNGKKPPRAIQGAGHLGVATLSDPTSGKVEKWGLEDPFSAAQWEEVAPNTIPYGLGDGPVAVHNVMDVSQPYGVIAGEGFPGGRAHFRGVNESCGRYLGGETGVVDAYPDVPKIPEMSDSICSLWIAKSSVVPNTTQSMCGMLTGSALGVVTAYSLGGDSNGPRYSNGDMTARWVLSPGVPIISLKIDDNYTMKRKLSSRVWAAALNALGEVYYLTQSPMATLDRGSGDDVIRHAWLAGRTAYWQLIESTRRTARPDGLDKDAVRGAHTPRSPSSDVMLSNEQLAAEAREVEKYLCYSPSRFRKVCEGWDMRRRLEVDFAADDGKGAGEGVFVMDCGFAEQTPARVLRYSRSLVSPTVQHEQNGPRRSSSTASAPARPRPSLFGPAETVAEMQCATPEAQSPQPPPPPPTPLPPLRQSTADWSCTAFVLQGSQQAANITASSLECSSPSLFTLGEDPLQAAGASSGAPGMVTAITTTTTTTISTTPATSSVDKAERVVTEVPGRRARFLAVGTDTGAVTVWNARDEARHRAAQPLRVLHTDSPEISCLAVSALYLVHGGSDGLVQAWDPLASTLEPIRTLNARSNGRVPRHMTTMNPTLREGSYSTVGAIYLDPDPTALRGVLSFGAFLRYWAYSSASHQTGPKRRVRHSDVHGRIASRRLGGTVSGYIAAEERELRRENEARAREQAHLRKRFGVGALGDLTEEEALRYAQVVSEEAYLQDEQRRASDSAADASLDTASSVSETTVDVTPEASVADVSPPMASATDNDESEFEQQMQQAIRLSLLEGVNDVGQSPRDNSSGDFDFPIQVKVQNKKTRGSRSTSTSPASSSHTPIRQGPSKLITEDGGLASVASPSLQEHEVAGPGVHRECDFPPLSTEGEGESVGKGRGRGRGRGTSRR
ncbi:F-box and WD domain protein [Metarhizium album ARSEF 1941]|uniref:F-box and WD domain protein n=1 Tax=Metarhizium album (strain ARSEF 1941) TaxID=1081103 RepID=A0A0B2WWL1_METAS|nr:F-box and WD domain protein [Metarhizium album ARSEF 1941]KHN98004.1 F-box and WD domain protein [Metarhizium album ARSEF 1941]